MNMFSTAHYLSWICSASQHHLWLLCQEKILSQESSAQSFPRDWGFAKDSYLSPTFLSEDLLSLRLCPWKYCLPLPHNSSSQQPIQLISSCDSITVLQGQNQVSSLFLSLFADSCQHNSSHNRPLKPYATVFLGFFISFTHTYHYIRL